jgi:hypothetical protein
MLLRPPRLAFHGDEARTGNTGLASAVLEQLVDCILESPDPWRALEDVRRKVPVYRFSRLEETELARFSLLDEARAGR